jgi:hypothetical protein
MKNLENRGKLLRRAERVAGIVREEGVRSPWEMIGRRKEAARHVVGLVLREGLDGCVVGSPTGNTKDSQKEIF